MVLTGDLIDLECEIDISVSKSHISAMERHISATDSDFSAMGRHISAMKRHIPATESDISAMERHISATESHTADETSDGLAKTVTERTPKCCKNLR